MICSLNCESPYVYSGDDIDSIRKRHFHQALVFTHTAGGDRWFDIVEDIIHRYGVNAKADLDFVLGISTEGVLYLNESSEIYEAAITLLSATEDQIMQCAIRPRDVGRTYKQRTKRMKQFFSDLRKLQSG